MIATYFQSTKNPFVFCTTLPTHKHSAKQQNRFSHPLSSEQRLGFIAQTFTILFAMYKPVDWQRLPLYPGDILGFSFPSKGFSAAYWKGGGTWQISFTLCPQQSWLYCSYEVGFCKPLSERKDANEKTSWLHVTLNQTNKTHVGVWCVFFCYCLSSVNYLVCSTFP